MIWSSTPQPDVLQPPKGWQWVNPVWLMSDQERNPDWTWWETFSRNMFANFNSVVIGVADKPRKWISTMGGENWPVKGWGFGWVLADDHWLPRPWICRRGYFLKMKILRIHSIPVLIYPTIANVEVGVGWKSHGGFGLDWRPANTPNAGPTP